MGGSSKYEFDVYTDRGTNRAVGITHGYRPSDGGESDYKKLREKEYSLDKILQAMNSMSSKLKHQWNRIADSY